MLNPVTVEGRAFQNLVVRLMASRILKGLLRVPIRATGAPGPAEITPPTSHHSQPYRAAVIWRMVDGCDIYGSQATKPKTAY